MSSQQPSCPHCKSSAPLLKVEDECYCESCGLRSKGFDRLRAEYAEYSPFPSEKLKQKAAAEVDPVRKQIFERLGASELADLSRTTGKDASQILAEWKRRRRAELKENGLMRGESRQPSEQQQKQNELREPDNREGTKAPHKRAPRKYRVLKATIRTALLGHPHVDNKELHGWIDRIMPDELKKRYKTATNPDGLISIAYKDSKFHRAIETAISEVRGDLGMPASN